MADDERTTALKGNRASQNVREWVKGVDRAIAHMLMGFVRLYQLVLSPLLGGQCRFYPTCSNYALEALGRHGGARGAGLAAWRVCRCHPGHPGGVDEVPGHLS